MLSLSALINPVPTFRGAVHHRGSTVEPRAHTSLLKATRTSRENAYTHRTLFSLARGALRVLSPRTAFRLFYLFYFLFLKFFLFVSFCTHGRSEDSFSLLRASRRILSGRIRASGGIMKDRGETPHGVMSRKSARSHPAAFREYGVIHLSHPRPKLRHLVEKRVIAIAVCLRRALPSLVFLKVFGNAFFSRHFKLARFIRFWICLFVSVCEEIDFLTVDVSM